VIADYTQVIRLTPNDADAYNNRGVAWYYKGDNDRAIVDYTEAIRLNPRLAPACLNRGVAWYYKGDNDRAIADYTEAVRLDPNYALAYNNRGTVYAAKGDNDRAIVDYTEAIRLSAKYADAYSRRARAYTDKEDYIHAGADWERVLWINPDNIDARDNLEALRQMAGMSSEQAQVAAQAANQRGATAYNQRDYDGAIQEFTEAIRLDPKFALAYSNRGNAYFYKMDYVHARADFEQVLVINHDNTDARNNLERLKNMGY
jgi:tetratricopeptide (TPR) repeat protein